MIVYVFLIVDKSHERTKTNDELILLTKIVCVARENVFLCAIAFHCCPTGQRVYSHASGFMRPSHVYILRTQYWTPEWCR